MNEFIEKGYLGNTNLKRKNTQQEWSEEMLKEWIKCKKDPVYFAEKYIKIVHVDHGLIPIQMYDYQKEIVDKITNNRRVAVVTSRQAGKTTTAVAVILHYVLFNSNKTVALLANKGDAAREILDRIQTAYEALPKWIQHGVIEWNKGSVEFENGCKIIAAATSGSAIRGKSISFLYIDETAFVENWDEFFKSVYPTISSGKKTKMLLTSTPNGLNHFYDICEGAREKVNGYEFVEVMWYDVPGRDEKWKEETLQALSFDEQAFAQEYMCQFLGSSGTLISGAKLKMLKNGIAIAQSSNINQYEAPEKGHIYVCVVDVSRGKGLDYSAFQMIDVTEMPYKQVLAYRDNTISPTEYSEAIQRICNLYNEAYVLIEVNDIGQQVVDILHNEYEYENILRTQSAGRAGKKISSGYGGQSEMGIRTTKPVKAIGCNVLKLLIEQNQLLIRDKQTIDEFKTFSRKNLSYEAEQGNNDDLVMCLVLFAWLSSQSYFKEMTDINTLSHLRERSLEDMENDMLPFGFRSDDDYTDVPLDDISTFW